MSYTVSETGHNSYSQTVSAGHLIPGDSLRTADGAWAKVHSVVDSGRTEPTFNLRVEKNRTYFVCLPGRRTAVLVHNESDSGVAPLDNRPLDGGSCPASL